MGVKAIKGHKKGSQDIAYFLSHGDTVILGSGNSKKTLTTKISEIDTALGGRATVKDITEALGQFTEDGGTVVIPIADVYTYANLPVDYVCSPGNYLFFIIPIYGDEERYIYCTSYENKWKISAVYTWSELSATYKGLINKARAKADTLESAVDTINGKIPATASSSNKLATASDVSAVATTANSALGKASITEQLLPSDVNPETNKLTTEKKRAKVVVKMTQHGVTTTSELGKLVQIVAGTAGGYSLSKVFGFDEITGDNPGVEIVLPYQIVEAMIADGAVTTVKMADGSVTTAKIVDGNVTKAKLAQEVLDFLEEYLADFKGTVETTAALKALTGDKNDWAVYKHNDANNNVIYSRYRYDASYNDNTTGHWRFELDVNSSSFTAAQWAAINSGATSSIINSVAGKAEKSEMSVTPGTGSNADKTTIQLKSGTSATVLTTHQDISGKKDKQTAVSDPSADGTAVAFIASFTQNANGDATVTKKTVQSASASQAGLMSAAHYSKLDAIEYATDSDIEDLFS